MSEANERGSPLMDLTKIIDTQSAVIDLQARLTEYVKPYINIKKTRRKISYVAKKRERFTQQAA